MPRRHVYQGPQFTVAFACDKGGDCPASEFFDSLDVSDKAKLTHLFRVAGDTGKFKNPEKFGDLGNGLYEFKSFQIRMPFAYAQDEPRLILVTHGFIKKRNKTPREEIKRARDIIAADREVQAASRSGKPKLELLKQRTKKQ